MLREPAPVLVAGLFPELLDELLNLLQGLDEEEWRKPTICNPWTVKDLAFHLLGDDLNILSRGRDRYFYNPKALNNWAELVEFINFQNEQWVAASRRFSPPILLDLLRLAGDQANAYFQMLNPFEIGPVVSWAGPDPAPMWLHVAREYTERWHHQQQLRDALDKPGLLDPHFLKPVLDTFVRALPLTFRDTAAPENSVVTLHIKGGAASSWSMVRSGDSWALFEGSDSNPAAEVTLPEDKAWRLFTKGIAPEEALAFAELTGEQSLGLTLLNTVAIIA